MADGRFSELLRAFRENRPTGAITIRRWGMINGRHSWADTILRIASGQPVIPALIWAHVDDARSKLAGANGVTVVLEPTS